MLLKCSVFLHCTSSPHLLDVQHHQFDGVVLEIWSQLGGHHKRLDILHHLLPLQLYCSHIYIVYVSLLIPGVPISLSPSLHFKQHMIAFSIFLVCVMVEDNTNGFFITHYNIYGIYIYICSELSQLVRLIAEHLHSEDLQTILVIPAMMRG